MFIKRLRYLSILVATCLVTNIHAGQSEFQEGVNGYEGTFDTQLRGATPDRDDSEIPELNPDGSDGGMPVHLLMRFENIFGDGPNQIPEGQSIFSATLTLWITNPGSDQQLYRMLVPWEETTTWNEISDPFDLAGVPLDGETAAIDPDVVFAAPAVTTEIELLPSTLQAWLDGSEPNYGWAFIPTGTDGADFPSSEFSEPTQRPKLTVIWGTPGNPFLFRTSPSPQGITLLLKDGEGNNARNVNQDSINLTFDGANVAPEISKDGDITTVTYNAPSLLTSGSIHDYSLTFSDDGASPTLQTEAKSFTVPRYTTIPASSRVAESDIDLDVPGFRVMIHQMEVGRPSGNFLPDPVTQARGELVDETIGEAFENVVDTLWPEEEDNWVADPAGSFTASQVFLEDTVINYNQDSRDNPDASAGNFGPDAPIPGIPGISGSNDNIAFETTTFLQLEPGFYRMGVNSDDGFVVSSSLNPRDALAIGLGLYDGGRGAADSLFDFAVEEAGFYPFTLHWWEGGGGANVEWFTIDIATDELTLINDADNTQAVKAFRSGPPLPPYAESATPNPGQEEVATDANIEIILKDTDREIQVDTVKLSLNGEALNADVSKSGDTTTVLYDPADNFAPESNNSVSLEFSDGTTSYRRDYSFKTAPEIQVLFAIDEQQIWRYLDSGDDLGTGWREPDFDDSAWASGAGLFGFESGATAEPLRTELPSGAVTYYFRTTFTFEGDLSAARLRLRHVVDDGAIFYLNGQEVHRFGFGPNAEVAFDSLAASHENQYEGFFEIDVSALLEGENVFAAEGHQTTADSSDFILGAELQAILSAPPSSGVDAAVSIERSESGATISFTGTLEASDSLTGPYSTVAGATSPHTVNLDGAEKFYIAR